MIKRTDSRPPTPQVDNQTTSPSTQSEGAKASQVTRPTEDPGVQRAQANLRLTQTQDAFEAYTPRNVGGITTPESLPAARSNAQNNTTRVSYGMYRNNIASPAGGQRTDRNTPAQATTQAQQQVDWSQSELPPGYSVGSNGRLSTGLAGLPGTLAGPTEDVPRETINSLRHNSILAQHLDATPNAYHEMLHQGLLDLPPEQTRGALQTLRNEQGGWSYFDNISDPQRQELADHLGVNATTLPTATPAEEYEQITNAILAERSIDALPTPGGLIGQAIGNTLGISGDLSNTIINDTLLQMTPGETEATIRRMERDGHLDGYLEGLDSSQTSALISHLGTPGGVYSPAHMGDFEVVPHYNNEGNMFPEALQEAIYEHNVNHVQGELDRWYEGSQNWRAGLEQLNTGREIRDYPPRPQRPSHLGDYPAPSGPYANSTEMRQQFAGDLNTHSRENRIDANVARRERIRELRGLPNEGTFDLSIEVETSAGPLDLQGELTFDSDGAHFAWDASADWRGLVEAGISGDEDGLTTHIEAGIDGPVELRHRVENGPDGQVITDTRGIDLGIYENQTVTQDGPDGREITNTQGLDLGIYEDQTITRDGPDGREVTRNQSVGPFGSTVTESPNGERSVTLHFDTLIVGGSITDDGQRIELGSGPVKIGYNGISPETIAALFGGPSSEADFFPEEFSNRANPPRWEELSPARQFQLETNGLWDGAEWNERVEAGWRP